ncbi:MAG TPA: CoA-acylating methylmalonate-semialdehyde dehydrogenase [Candidatus Lokiarchaeia archaeon]|nr:CoA-acylating methylmalonate-semialdehyde dehydrogenase [Candidatus Lokiarchaeia archaeon]
MEILKNYINGEFVESESTSFLDAMNPATDEVLAQVPMSTQDEVNAAVAAAVAAFPAWRNTPGIQRIQPILKLQELLKENIETLTEITVMNHGKEWDAAEGEVVRAYQMCEAAIAVPEMQKGEFMEDIATGIDEYTVRIPLGVFVMIPPFNFPVMIPFWFMPFAVAAGNTYIIKSNEQTSVPIYRIFESCIDKAGFPPGVINLIHGGPDVGTWLIEHPDVKGVSSVGSTPVAKMIYTKATSLGKRAQCHGGANNFIVVDMTANFDKIMSNMMNSIFGNSGQRCLAGKHVVIVGDEEFYGRFKDKFITTASGLVVGYGVDKTSFMGPIVARKNLDKLNGQIQQGIDDGASLVLDGREISVPGYENGYFLGPCIFENVQPGNSLLANEVFGPVACLYRVDTLDEAIAMINADFRGNATTIYTESGENARHFRHDVQAGNVGINIGIVAPLAWFPFAGAKESFFGTLRAQGREAVEFFTQAHVIIERFHGTGGAKFWD